MPICADMTAAQESFRITVPVMSRSTRILTWLVLVLLVGGHWGALQVVAWSGMLIHYSRDASFAEAWDKTFDGDHPCALCKTVDRGIADDLDAGTDQPRKAPSKVIKPVKLDALVTDVVLVLPIENGQVLPGLGTPAPLVGLTQEPPRRPPQVMG
jgi:hypothetical protein